MDAVTWGLVGGILVTGSGALFALGRWLFRKDTEIENRRRAAGLTAAELKKRGVQHIPELLIDYSVGDYSGMLARVSAACEMIGDPARCDAFFNEQLLSQIGPAMSNAALRGRIVQVVAPFLTSAEDIEEE